VIPAAKPITELRMQRLFPRSGRFVGKNEAAGAADAGLCHTEAVWAEKDRHISFAA
jgi:hypothetical protein